MRSTFDDGIMKKKININKQKNVHNYSHILTSFWKINTNKIIIIISKINITNTKQTLLKFHLKFLLLILKTLNL
jgi:hypothetical protein